MLLTLASRSASYPRMSSDAHTLSNMTTSKLPAPFKFMYLAIGIIITPYVPGFQRMYTHRRSRWCLVIFIL